MGSRDNYTFENHAAIPYGLGDVLSAFFQSWDDPHSNNDYLDLFAPDGELVFGPAVAKGRDAIQGLREGMVHPKNGPVVDLEHTLGKCFVLAGGAEQGRQEIIVNGSIWYKLKNGRKVDADFASYMVFQGGEAKPEATFYQVYLDSHELMTAITAMKEGNY
ncbi:hypothetical protein LTR67_011052 [Exophiala xenobiotica]